jgi:hypothetical protein
MSGAQHHRKKRHLVGLGGVVADRTKDETAVALDKEIPGSLGIARLERSDDQSIYLMPHLTYEYELQVPDQAGNQVTLSIRPGKNLHISLHESGMINLTAGSRKVCLRGPHAERSQEGQLFTLAINAGGGLRGATIEELNRLPTRYKPLALMGFLEDGPIRLTVYRVARGTAWQVPTLSDRMQLHFKIELRDKGMDYHFVMWQNAVAPRMPGDVSFRM